MRLLIVGQRMLGVVSIAFFLFPSFHCVSFDFFFFQAEDGIRDTSVTGVQTCALPIARGARVGGRRLGRGGPGVARGRPRIGAQARPAAVAAVGGASSDGVAAPGPGAARDRPAGGTRAARTARARAAGAARTSEASEA